MYILQKRHPIYGHIGFKYTDKEFESLIPADNKHLFRYTNEDSDDLSEDEEIFALDNYEGINED